MALAAGLLQGIGGGMQMRQDRQLRQRELSAMEAMGQNRGGQTRPGPAPMGMGVSDIAGVSGGGGAFPASLIQAESGGNWRALNNEVGSGGTRGHGGRLQFGQARLQDAARAGVIPQMTPQQFAASSPEIQMAAENWHFRDIDEAIDATGGIGQMVNGVPLTRDALRAVAHLGGSAGMSQFVRSGGQYNPSDSFGTSLMDYATNHSGNGARSAQPAQNRPAQPTQPAGRWSWANTMLTGGAGR